MRVITHSPSQLHSIKFDSVCHWYQNIRKQLFKTKKITSSTITAARRVAILISINFQFRSMNGVKN